MDGSMTEPMTVADIRDAIKKAKAAGSMYPLVWSHEQGCMCYAVWRPLPKTAPVYETSLLALRA
jgi:hypothetical protein